MGKKRAGQPGYREARDKNGRRIWVPDNTVVSSGGQSASILVDTLRGETGGMSPTERIDDFTSTVYDEVFVDLDDTDTYYSINWGGEKYESGDDFLNDVGEEIFANGKTGVFDTEDGAPWGENTITLHMPTNPTNSLVDMANQRTIQSMITTTGDSDGDAVSVDLKDFFGDDPTVGVPQATKDVVGLLSASTRDSYVTLSDSDYADVYSEHVDSIAEDAEALLGEVDDIAEEDAIDYADRHGWDYDNDEADYGNYTDYMKELREDYRSALHINNGVEGYDSSVMQSAVRNYMEQMELDGEDPGEVEVNDYRYRDIVMEALKTAEAYRGGED